jgi:outer membrane protein assembly factor BamD (BamD/ComL family)
MSVLFEYRGLRIMLGIIYCFLLIHPLNSLAQAGYQIDLNKPPKFEDKTLASEKSTTTKNTVLRKFVQSTVTHYNYYFNANQKLIMVLNNARLSQKDDLTSLIPFYGYSLSNTKSQRKELDSVIYKSTAGIVLHDLRNGWIDNLYLLIGQAYFFETKFDSADHMLQFLNYQFYIKEKGDYHIPIGTRDQSQDGQLSIFNPENDKIYHRAFNRPPSRNDGLLWQVRSYTEQGKYAQAAGLISLLRADPILPSRLKPFLAEQEAYWFYRQEMWDSTAVYLQQALSNSWNMADQARWEYLLAQLSERTHKDTSAIVWYTKSIDHTTDPRLDIYAHLYRALLSHASSKDAIPSTIAALERLAKKDRYAPFRDILYLAAAKLALETPDTTQAMHFLNQSVKTIGKGEVKNQSWLLMADLAKADGNYKIVAKAYDSLMLSDTSLKPRVQELTKDRVVYDRLLASILAVEREDSLQRIAALPSEARMAYVKDLLRKLLRAQGLKDAESNYGTGLLARDSTSTNIFTNSGGTGNVDWYFYNTNTRAQGAADFQNQWGSRPNVDNWRRESAITAMNVLRNQTPEDVTGTGKKTVTKGPDLTISGLLAGLPLTPKTLEASNDTIAGELYKQGDIYKNQVGDYKAAVKVLEELYQRYPTYKTEPTLFNLYFCWHQLGNEPKAQYYYDLLHQKFPNGAYVGKLNQAATPEQDPAQIAATSKYKEIYDQFIGGNYDTALQMKKAADSLFGNKFWTPQLLYIQAVYYAHEKQDTQAIRTLSSLISQFPKDPMTPKATKLKDVLSRRKEIELYLNNLHVVRDKEDSLHIDTGTVVAQAPAVVAPPPPKDLRRQRSAASDSTAFQPGNVAALKPGASSMIPNAGGSTGIHSDNYIFDPTSNHYVMVITTGVAGVFFNEAKTAFSRYNQSTHYNDTIYTDTLSIVPGVRIIRFGTFRNIIDALAYEFELQKNAAKEIVPWLAKDKYQLIVISDNNLAVLLQKKDLQAYNTFISSYLKNLPPVK